MSFLVWDRAKIWRTGRHPQQEFRVYLNDCQNFLADPSRETLSFSGLWARAVWAKTQAKGAQVRLGEARWSLMGFWPSRSARSRRRTRWQTVTPEVWCVPCCFFFTSDITTGEFGLSKSLLEIFIVMSGETMCRLIVAVTTVFPASVM